MGYLAGYVFPESTSQEVGPNQEALGKSNSYIRTVTNDKEVMPN